MQIRSLLPCLLILGLVPPSGGAARAQDMPLPTGSGSDTTLVDRVVAVVGDSVIPMSLVQEEVVAARAQGQQVEFEDVLNNLVELQLVLQAAARDTTLQVPEEEIDGRVEQAYAEVRNRFPTEDRFREALAAQGMTPQMYREELRTRIGTQQVQQMFLRRQLQSAPPVSVTEREMREFFEEQRASLEQRPEILRIQQVIIEPTASDTAWARAEADADSLVALLGEGADFEELAREHSEDPASADQGGDMGWFRRGVMVPEFERAAFSLRRDRVSDPVRTRFGYHIIRVDRQRPGEVKARHILIRPEVSPEDRARAAERARDVAERARAGEPMDSLYDAFGSEDFPATIEPSRDQLPELPYPGYAEALSDASEGEVIGPLEGQMQGNRYHIVLRVDEIRAAGDFTFEDLRDQIQQALTQQKRLERIYEKLRDATYVDIRM